MKIEKLLEQKRDELGEVKAWLAHNARLGLNNDAFRHNRVRLEAQVEVLEELL